MSYEPRGKVKLLIDAMGESPQAIWPAADVAKVMDIPQANIPAYLGAATSHGLIYRKLDSGKSFFSLKPFPENVVLPPAPAPAWRAPVMTPPRAAAPTPAPAGGGSSWPLLGTAPVPPAAPAPIATKASAPAAVEPEDEVEEAAQEFNAALWADGDLMLYGLEELVDGGFKVAAENVPMLKRLLGGVPA